MAQEEKSGRSTWKPPPRPLAATPVVLPARAPLQQVERAAKAQPVEKRRASGGFPARDVVEHDGVQAVGGADRGREQAVGKMLQVRGVSREGNGPGVGQPDARGCGQRGGVHVEAAAGAVTPDEGPSAGVRGVIVVEERVKLHPPRGPRREVARRGEDPAAARPQCQLRHQFELAVEGDRRRVDHQHGEQVERARDHLSIETPDRLPHFQRARQRRRGDPEQAGRETGEKRFHAREKGTGAARRPSRSEHQMPSTRPKIACALAV